jgi:hypothetical protein
MAVTRTSRQASASMNRVHRELPTAIRVVLVLTLSCSLGYAVVVTPLALVDHFEKSTVLIAATVCAALLVVVWLRAILPFRRSRMGASTIVALSTIGVMTALNARFASQNVVQDRDPGAYVDSAQWFAHHNTFFFDGLVGPFARHPLQLFVAGAGFKAGAPGGRVYPQFLHVVPAFLAAVNWIGGTSLMFRANALLAAVALLAFFAFARTWLDHRLAAFATVLLAVNAVQVLHSRNTYSEILTQVFLFGGLWALTEADRVGRVSLYAIAGLLLGATCMVRIDAFVFLIPLTLIATVRLWRAQGRPESDVVHVRRTVVAAAGGVLCMSALGLIDGMRFSRPYIDDNLSFLAQIAAAWIATVAVCWFALRRHARGSRPSLKPQTIARLGSAAAIVIVVFFAWAWFVRPHTEIGHQSARPAGGAFDLRERAAPAKVVLRTYSEQTVPRLDLFLGPAILAGGILGLAFVTRRVISDPDDPRLSFLLLFGVTTVLYVWRPSIAADMVWFLRRFLPVTIPGLILFAMVLTEELQRVGKRFALLAAALIMAGGLALPIVLLPHYLFHSTHVPLAEGVQLACNRLGPDAAVVIVQSAQLDLTSGPQYRYPQALQAFCRIPVATAPPGLGADFYRSLAAEWAQQGRTLNVVADLPQALTAVPGDARVLQESKYRVLERTLKRWPTHYDRESLILFFKPVPARA